MVLPCQTDKKCRRTFDECWATVFFLEQPGRALFSHDYISLIETRNCWGLDTSTVSQWAEKVLEIGLYKQIAPLETQDYMGCTYPLKSAVPFRHSDTCGQHHTHSTLDQVSVKDSAQATPFLVFLVSLNPPSCPLPSNNGSHHLPHLTQGTSCVMCRYCLGATLCCLLVEWVTQLHRVQQGSWGQEWTMDHLHCSFSIHRFVKLPLH